MQKHVRTVKKVIEQYSKKSTEAIEEKYNNDNNQNDFFVDRREYMAL